MHEDVLLQKHSLYPVCSHKSMVACVWVSQHAAHHSNLLHSMALFNMLCTAHWPGIWVPSLLEGSEDIDVMQTLV